jgi:hypothetical protein
LEAIGVQVAKKDVKFLMANGQAITRDIGYAIIRVDEFGTVDEVVFGKKGDLKLLGLRTLEGFASESIRANRNWSLPGRFRRHEKKMVR